MSKADTGAPEQKGGILPESLRKAVTLGLSAVFMTEEGIRNALGDLRLPKEAIGYIVEQTDKARRDVHRVVEDQLKGFLERIDVRRELRKALVGMRMEIEAKVRFVEDADGEVKPEAKVEVKRRRSTENE